MSDTRGREQVPAQRQPRSRATKNDIDLARIRADEEAARRRFRLAEQAIIGFRTTFWIAATWIPLQVVEKIANDIAGKETHFDANLNIAVAVSAILTVGWGISAVKSHGRKKKILRLRKRTDELENLLRVRDLERG